MATAYSRVRPILATYGRTNLLLRQLTLPFGVPKFPADRIIDRLGRTLALQQRKWFRKGAVLIEDGALAHPGPHRRRAVVTSMHARPRDPLLSPLGQLTS
ncbi:hypothetical protein HYQ63_35935 [Streptomyces sp. Rer75]|nr:hypothetical protein HYQ63_35935 [Streptomyces sp. Rer75]